MISARYKGRQNKTMISSTQSMVIMIGEVGTKKEERCSHYARSDGFRRYNEGSERKPKVEVASMLEDRPVSMTLYVVDRKWCKMHKRK